MTKTRPTVDSEEVRRFSQMSSEWWDPNGKFRPLHKIGPARIAAIRDAICDHYGRETSQKSPLSGLSILDIGCGGGLVCEPLARLGATVSGIDPSEKNIAVASQHAAGQNLSINYRAALIEDIVAGTEQYDCVLCLEVVEHVPDVPSFVALCAKSVRPGGVMVLSTINRTLKAFALAIVGAEYVLRWLPIGTHQWDRFVRPEELRRHVRQAGMEPKRCDGLVYNPLTDKWSLSPDTDVNYVLSAAKP